MMHTSERAMVLNPNEPLAIWMPAPLQTSVPDIYRGTPFEIVDQMAKTMKPGLSTDDAIGMLQQSMAGHKLSKIRFEALPTKELRAAAFVVALLLTGIARQMPDA